MWLAYSSALPNKPSFWTVSTSVNIWVFALKLFVCDNAIKILNRARVWPWDGRILTNLVVFIEIESSEDMAYHFSKRLVLILGLVLVYEYQKPKHFPLADVTLSSWPGGSWWVEKESEKTTHRKNCSLLLPDWSARLSVLGLLSDCVRLQISFPSAALQRGGRKRRERTMVFTLGPSFSVLLER